MNMRVGYRLLGELAKGRTKEGWLEVAEPASVKDLVDRLEIKDEVLALIGGKRVDLSRELKPGEEVTLMTPALGG